MATYLIEHNARYVFTIKDNQPTLREAIRLIFEDHCTLRTTHSPQNITALRRFAIGAIRSKSRDTVAATIQRLARNVRLVFDYLRMTDNSPYRPPSPQVQGG